MELSWRPWHSSTELWIPNFWQARIVQWKKVSSTNVAGISECQQVEECKIQDITILNRYVPNSGVLKFRKKCTTEIKDRDKNQFINGRVFQYYTFANIQVIWAKDKQNRKSLGLNNIIHQMNLTDSYRIFQ